MATVLPVRRRYIVMEGYERAEYLGQGVWRWVKK